MVMVQNNTIHGIPAQCLIINGNRLSLRFESVEALKNFVSWLNDDAPKEGDG